MKERRCCEEGCNVGVHSGGKERVDGCGWEVVVEREPGVGRAQERGALYSVLRWHSGHFFL